MSKRFRVPFLLLLLLPVACGGGEASAPGGASITVRVDGRTHRFEAARAELHSFLGDSWLLDVSSGQGDGTDLSFAFFTEARTAAELSGRSLENDYREHNPERYPLEDILNFVRVGGREYQGHRVEGTVRSVSDAQITIEIRGTFLEFPADWDETEEDAEDETVLTGREVELFASITVPLAVESL